MFLSEDQGDIIDVRTQLAIKTHAILEKYFPERRVFLKSCLLYTSDAADE